MSSRSGAEVRDALMRGQPVSWGFNPKERRVVLKLPRAFGGEEHILCIAGHYTFVARPPGGLFMPRLLVRDLVKRGGCAIKQVFQR